MQKGEREDAETAHGSASRILASSRQAFPQGCRKFETVRYNKILNPKVSHNMRKIWRHLAKVSKNPNFVYTPSKALFNYWTF